MFVVCFLVVNDRNNGAEDGNEQYSIRRYKQVPKVLHPSQNGRPALSLLLTPVKR